MATGGGLSERDKQELAEAIQKAISSALQYRGYLTEYAPEVVMGAWQQRFLAQYMPMGLGPWTALQYTNELWLQQLMTGTMPYVGMSPAVYAALSARFSDQAAALSLSRIATASFQAIPSLRVGGGAALAGDIASAYRLMGMDVNMAAAGLGPAYQYMAMVAPGLAYTPAEYIIGNRASLSSLYTVELGGNLPVTMAYASPFAFPGTMALRGLAGLHDYILSSIRSVSDVFGLPRLPEWLGGTVRDVLSNLFLNWPQTLLGMPNAQINLPVRTPVSAFGMLGEALTTPRQFGEVMALVRTATSVSTLAGSFRVFEELARVLGVGAPEVNIQPGETADAAARRVFSSWMRTVVDAFAGIAGETPGSPRWQQAAAAQAVLQRYFPNATTPGAALPLLREMLSRAQRQDLIADVSALAGETFQRLLESATGISEPAIMRELGAMELLTQTGVGGTQAYLRSANVIGRAATGLMGISALTYASDPMRMMLDPFGGNAQAIRIASTALGRILGPVASAISPLNTPAFAGLNMLLGQPGVALGIDTIGATTTLREIAENTRAIAVATSASNQHLSTLTTSLMQAGGIPARADDARNAIQNFIALQGAAVWERQFGSLAAGPAQYLTSVGMMASRGFMPFASDLLAPITTRLVTAAEQSAMGATNLVYAAGTPEVAAGIFLQTTPLAMDLAALPYQLEQARASRAGLTATGLGGQWMQAGRIAIPLSFGGVMGITSLGLYGFQQQRASITARMQELAVRSQILARAAAGVAFRDNPYLRDIVQGMQSEIAMQTMLAQAQAASVAGAEVQYLGGAAGTAFETAFLGYHPLLRHAGFLTALTGEVPAGFTTGLAGETLGLAGVRGLIGALATDFPPGTPGYAAMMEPLIGGMGMQLTNALAPLGSVGREPAIMRLFTQMTGIQQRAAISPLVPFAPHVFALVRGGILGRIAAQQERYIREVAPTLDESIRPLFLAQAQAELETTRTQMAAAIAPTIMEWARRQPMLAATSARYRAMMPSPEGFAEYAQAAFGVPSFELGFTDRSIAEIAQNLAYGITRGWPELPGNLLASIATEGRATRMGIDQVVALLQSILNELVQQRQRNGLVAPQAWGPQR